MTEREIIRLRMQNQHLIGPLFQKPEDVVRHFGAVQAQDYPGAKWAVGQRVKNCTDADVEKAFNTGKILRTHVMRPTWHFVLPADIRWMQMLTAPRVRPILAHYDRKIGLTDAMRRKSQIVFSKALSGGKHLTRLELGEALRKASIPASGQLLAHLTAHAELDALICSGPIRGKAQTYALLDERAPKAKILDREAALAELTKRYFISHGPALMQDFAWWSGLTMVDVRAGIELVKKDLEKITVGEKTYWSGPIPKAVPIKNPVIHLLPNYDEYFIAYKDRSILSHASLPKNTKLLYDALSRHIIFLNGQVIGGWKTTIHKNKLVITKKLFLKLSLVMKKALDLEIKLYQDF